MTDDAMIRAEETGHARKFDRAKLPEGEKMMFALKFLRIGLLAVIAGLMGGRALAADTTFHVILKGGNEVSTIGNTANAGDPDGYGSASVVFRNNRRLCYSIIVMMIGAPTAAHIHRGPAGVNGDIEVPLTPPANGNLGATGACIPIDGALGREISNNPAEFYINVHNGEFPGGALRGQLF